MPLSPSVFFGPEVPWSAALQAVQAQQAADCSGLPPSQKKREWKINLTQIKQKRKKLFLTSVWETYKCVTNTLASVPTSSFPTVPLRLSSIFLKQALSSIPPSFLRWITSKFICFWWSVCSNYSVWINNSFLGCLLLMRFTHSARGHIFVFVFVFVTCAFYSLRSRSLSSRNLPWTSGIDIMLHCYTFQFDQFALLHKEHFWRMKIWNAIELNINRSSLTSNNVYL